MELMSPPVRQCVGAHGESVTQEAAVLYDLGTQGKLDLAQKGFLMLCVSVCVCVCACVRLCLCVVVCLTRGWL